MARAAILIPLMVRAGDTMAGRFRVDGIAGTGGMGTVARAVDLLDNHRPVAVKVLTAADPRSVERFDREAAVLAHLTHDHIVGYVDRGILADGTPWLAMEWVDGANLSSLLANRRLDLDESLALARGVASGLAAAHAQGIVHRDIKPANLLLPDGAPARVKLADFGIARLSRQPTLTRTGATLGTPGYMAPEQAQGRPDVDARADVFSVGAVLFECLSGHPPFAGEHAIAVLAKVLLDEPPRLADTCPGLPSQLDALVARLLSKSSDERPADGGELLRMLSGVVLPVSGDVRTAPPGHAIVTTSEQRLVSLVLVETEVAPLGVTESADLHEPAPDDPFTQLAERYRARRERLVDGSSIFVFSGRGAAKDLAIRAARAALEAAEIAPGAHVVVATGRAELGQKWPVGDTVDEAARLLSLERRVRSRRVRIDDLTAGLVGASVNVASDREGFLLLPASMQLSVRRRFDSGGPCVGRERELGLLTGVYAECVEEEDARSVLVVSPAGGGKSRLVYELELRLGSGGDTPNYLFGQSDELRTRAPYGLIADVVRRAATAETGIANPAGADIRALARHHHSGADAIRIGTFLAEVAGVVGDGDVPEALRAARRDPPLMADQLRRAVVDWVSAEARERPLVIVLEDIHWADSASLALLRHVLTVVESPLLLVATARPRIGVGNPVDAGRATRIELSELGRKASGRVVDERLGPDLDDALRRRIIERAEGNPFVLEELARAVKRGGARELPATALATAQSRLEALPATERLVLRAASVFGGELDRSAIAALVGPLTELDSIIDRLVADNLLQSSGGTALRFRHDLLREAAYAMLPERDRCAGHLGAAQWLERLHAADPFVIAEHLTRAGERVRAAHYFALAGRSAFERNDLATAIDLAERGARLEPNEEARGLLCLLRAETELWRGNHGEAAGNATCAMELLSPASPEWLHAADALLQTAGRLGRGDTVKETLAAVDEHRPVDGAGRIEWLSVTVTGVRELLRLGKYSRASALLREVESRLLGAPESDSQLRAELAYVRGMAALHAGDSARQLSCLVEALAGYENVGNQRMACSMRGEIGFTYLQLGALQHAHEALTTSLREAEALGLGHVRAWILSLLTPVYTERGELDRAVAVGKNAVRAFEQQQDQRLAGATRAYLATAYAERGDLASAVIEAEHAVAALERFEPVLGLGLAVLARVRLLCGKHQQALAASRRGVAIRDKLGQLEEGDALLLECHADALELTGAGAAATRVRDEARALVRERAASITVDTLRRSFESGLAVHRRLLGIVARHPT